MKKLLLALFTLAFGVTGAQAQQPVNAVNDLNTLFTQLGLPYTNVTAFNVGSASKGYVPLGQAVVFTVFLGSGNNWGLYTYGGSGEYERAQSGPPWYAIGQGSSYAALTNATTGQPIQLKLKGDGTLKPIQITSDGNFIVFDQNGYYYKVRPDDVFYNQTYTINLETQSQGN